MVTDNQPEKYLLEMADSCVDFVQRSLGLPLDYTQDTLPILDHYLRTAREQAGEVGEARRAGSENLLSPIVAAAGAYFGTLICKLFPDAHFVGEGDDYGRYRVQFERIFLHFNPIAIAQEVLSGADADGMGAHFSTLDDQRKIVEQTLTQGIELKPADYYSFSVRYETLEQVIDVLTELESLRKGEPRVFGPDVYGGLLQDGAAKPEELS